MSARIRMRVLRVPCEKVGVADPWAFSEAHESEFPALGTCPYFAVAPTVRPFIDYVLRDQISDAQSFGKTRSLTPAEKRRYGPAFRMTGAMWSFAFTAAVRRRITMTKRWDRRFLRAAGRRGSGKRIL